MKNRLKLSNKQRSILSKSLFFVLMFVLLTLTIVYIPNSNTTKGKVNLKAGTWNSNLAEITGSTDESQLTYIPIKNFFELDATPTAAGNSNTQLIKTVFDPITVIGGQDKVATTRIMLVDGLDVYYFSELCNPTLSNKTANAHYVKYLSLNYVLGDDIDYEDASKNFMMLRPIGWGQYNNEVDYRFKGLFDGRGYTISNIFFKPYDDAADFDKFNIGMINVAWFSNNAGTIKNLGIINPNIIQYDIYKPAINISPFVGQNFGTIENCYVQDLRGNGAGLLAEGGYSMSMFASGNATGGTIKNSYVAVDRISAGSVAMTDQKHRFPFIGENNGTLENCYFDKTILEKSKNTYTEVVSNGLIPLTTSEFQSDKFNYYKQIDATNKVEIWHSNYTYGDKYATYMNLTYPVLKGFGIKKVEGIDYFMVEDAVDLVYMSELIDIYQPFRSASFLLCNTVDLNSVKPNSFVFSPSVFTGVLKGDVKADDGYTVNLANSTASDLNSILNLNVHTGVSYNGFHCYGLFGIMAGVVQDINLVNVTINQDDIAETNFNEINTIGTVCGLMEGGSIKNVNVLSTIELNSKDTTKFLGKEQVGGICGTATKGTIEDCTTSGTITAPVYAAATTTANNYEHSIGGILGRAENNDGVINCLNNMIITTPTYNEATAKTYRQYVGGVIGSGIIKNTNKLQNNAPITIPTGNYYSIMYIGGVIGRVEGASGVNGVYLNNADITYEVNDKNYKAYISGVMNIISTVASNYDKYSITLDATNVQNEINAVNTFEFKSLSNAGTLNIMNGLSQSKVPAKYESIDSSVTDGIDIRTAGISYSFLTNFNVIGAYNLDHHYEWSGTQISKVPNDAQSIDISMIDKFAPIFNADNRIAYKNDKLHFDTNYLNKSNTIKVDTPKLETSINAERCYNHRDINYVTNKRVDCYTLQLSGNVNGKNFNLTNARNEGNIKVYFTKATHNVYKMNSSPYFEYFGDYKKLKVFGVLEEISLDYRAKDIYNGGNITVSSGSGITPNFNLYISGICYKNIGNDPAINENLMVKKGYVGSLHNCVNNGNIRITSGDILTSEQIEGGNFYGQSRAAGIACINSSTISTTFNLGDIFNINNVKNVEKSDGGDYGRYPDTGEFEVETGGICFIMQNEVYDKAGNTTRGNIIDSANNGNVISMNSGNNYTWTNAGGFVGRNDRSEDGPLVTESSSISKAPHLQKIEYSINYGNVYAYNPTSYSASEQQSKAAGFVCLGACTVVDVINYGKIYSDSVASGMFGYLMMGRMITAKNNFGNNDPMYIANAINYGVVRNIEKTTENANKLKNIKDTDTITTLDVTVDQFDRVAGALIGMLTGINNDSHLSFINVKNLVNFNDKVNILGDTSGVTDGFSANAKKTATQFMATTNTNDKSPVPFNKGSSSTYQYGVKSYSKDTNDPNPNASNVFSAEYNGGIFNINYTLRNAPEFTYTDQKQTIIDSNNTDNFIADYIQFIPYSKVNDALIEKIGLKDVVLANALNNARNSYRTINGILKHLNNNDTKMNKVYDTLIKEQYAKLDTLKNDLIVEINNSINKNNYTTEELKAILTILKGNVDAYNAAFQLQDVKDIVIQLVNNLSQTEIDNLLNSLLTDQNITKIITKYPTELAAYLEIMASTKPLDQNYLNALRTIYHVLTSNTDSLNAFMNSLTEPEKDALATELYNLLKTNANVESALSRLYPEIVISDANDLTKLKQIIVPNTNKGNTNITLDEYKKIYSAIAAKDQVDNDVVTKINSLDANQIRKILDQLTTASNDPTSDLYKFLDDGRKKATGLNFPTTKANYINVVNKTNFNIATQNDINTDFSSGNFVYSGNVYSVDGTTTNSKTNIKVVPGQRQGEYQKEVWFWTELYYYAYQLNGTNFNYTEWNANNAGPAGFLKLEYNVVTGIYAQEGGKPNGNQVPNYTNTIIYNYIDYGTGAQAKNNLDLTKYMMLAWNNLDTLNLNKELQLFRDYLVKIYNASTVNKDLFKALVFEGTDLTGGKNKKQILSYINNNLNVQNSNLILKYITNNNVKKNIAKQLAKNYSTILDTLLKELHTSNNVTDNEKLLTLVTNMFREGNSFVSSNAQLTSSLKTIILGLSNENKVKFVKDIAEIFGPTIIDNLFDSLTFEQYKTIIIAMLDSDIQLLKQFHSSLINKLDYETKAAIATYLIKGDEALFKQYIYNGTSLEGLIELINSVPGLDASDVTDYTGIYALASSYGIENGLFLPDNIGLSSIDPYNQNGSSDSSWRGGTPDNPNGYETVGPDGSIVNNTNCVNYKVYYEMKQLKKSIATMVFEVELVGVKGGVEDHSIIVKNNKEFNYHINEQVGGQEINRIDFFIPRNHDILKNDKLVFHTTDNEGNIYYELSHGATFSTDDIFEINLAGPYNTGDEIFDTFIVQAEDTKVRKTYTIRILITEESKLDPLRSVIVDGQTASKVDGKRTVPNSTVVITDTKVTTKVLGYNGKIIVEYGTVNLQNKFDLLPTTKVYRTDIATIGEISLTDPTAYIDQTKVLTLNKDYYYSNTETNNGKVFIKSANDDTGLRPDTNTYANGIVKIAIDLDNYLTKGVYVMEIGFNEELKYYVFFEKDASTQANLESITYNGQKFVGGSGVTNNQNNMASHQFGKPMTEADFKQVDMDGNNKPIKPTHLDEFKISPLATFTIDSVTVNGNQSPKVYQVHYTITAESGATSNFTHYITETSYSRDIKTVYVNGGVKQNNIPAVADNQIIYQDSFEKTDNPSFRFEYDLSGFYTAGGTSYFEVVFTDQNGVELPASPELDKLKASVTIVITEGKDFEVVYFDQSISTDYYFKLKYINSVKFNQSTTLNWDVSFNTIKLTKLKYKNSYFDNIIFSSDAVIASIRTIIDVKNITQQYYEELLDSPYRPIVCLPGKIHYNEYDYNTNKQSDFYVIGLVSRTMLDFYTPTFTPAEGAKVYRTKMEGSTVYRYLPYYETDPKTLTVFQVSENGQTFRDEMGNPITVNGNVNAFSYNGHNYTLSPVAGYVSVMQDGVLIENTSLRTNYTESGTINPETSQFSYVTYRVYAEIYDDITNEQEKAKYYTDYHIATQDITNNIKFNIIIDKESGCTIDTASYMVYVELLCETLVEQPSDYTGPDVYELTNRAGIFADFSSGNLVSTHENLQSNTAGKYRLNIIIPKDYTYTFTFSDGGYTSPALQPGKQFEITSGLIARTVEIHITIKNGTQTNTDDWGVHTDHESIFK